MASAARPSRLARPTNRYAPGSRSAGYAISVGDAQSGVLQVAYDDAAPAHWSLNGGIILGIAEDNTNRSQGTFSEGAITAGRPTNATDELVLANVQAVGYCR